MLKADGIRKVTIMSDQAAKNFIKSLFNKFLTLVLPVRKQVFFESFYGKQYSDNPRAISEKLHEMDPSVRIVWSMNEKRLENNIDLIPEYVRIVRRRTMQYRISLIRSFCYVTNEALRPDDLKRNKQYFIQSWHADRVFKKVLYECWNNEKKGDRPVPVMDEYMTDLCVAGSAKGEELYREAFRYHGEILKCGCPRNDKLINISDAEKLEIKKRIGISPEKKVLLYAPTYRDRLRNLQDPTIDLKRTVKTLEENGDEWVCLIRAHTNSKGIRFDYTEKYVNVTFYPDMADILSVTDMLITDYSTSATDFVITGKPVILAAFDKAEYTANCRELKIDISEPGFIIADTQEDLEEIIRKTSEEKYADSDKKVMEFFGTEETGYASQSVCERIINYYNKTFKKRQS